MNYELCKRLKDIGFPQEPRIELPNSLEEPALGGFYWGFPTEGGCGGLAFFTADELKKEQERPREPHQEWTFVKSPTLSELIEACGVRFKSLTYYPITQDAKWIAEGVENEVGGSTETPEEAVDNLWLALQEMVK